MPVAESDGGTVTRTKAYVFKIKPGRMEIRRLEGYKAQPIATSGGPNETELIVAELWVYRVRVSCKR